MHHEQDMRRMGGLRKYMPVTFATMFVGWLAISGIPIFAGFFSKDEILWKTWSTEAAGIPHGFGKVLWAIGALTALLTAIYMTRLMVMTFWGAERFREASAGGQSDEARAHAFDEGIKPHDARMPSGDDRPHHAPDEQLADEDEEADHAHHGPVTPHESPWVMTVPLVVLAILSIIGGLVGIPYALSSLVGAHVPNYFEQVLEPAIAHAPESAGAEGGAHEGAPEQPQWVSPQPPAHDGAAPLSVGEGAQNEPAAERTHSPEVISAERLFTVISVLIAIAGIVAGWFWFQKKPLQRMPRLLEEKYYVDEIYDATIINPINVGSREGLWKLFDVAVIDGIVNGLGRGVTQIGALVRYLQIGFVRSYAAIILLGALFVIGFFAYYGIQVLIH
jgi:NADH-quinone oxidoreductase subunit L